MVQLQIKMVKVNTGMLILQFEMVKGEVGEVKG